MKPSGELCSVGHVLKQVGQTEELLDRQIEAQPEGTYANNFKSQLQSHMGAVRAGVNLR